MRLAPSLAQTEKRSRENVKYEKSSGGVAGQTLSERRDSAERVDCGRKARRDDPKGGHVTCLTVS